MNKLLHLGINNTTLSNLIPFQNKRHVDFKEINYSYIIAPPLPEPFHEYVAWVLFLVLLEAFAGEDRQHVLHHGRGAA